MLPFLFLFPYSIPWTTFKVSAINSNFIPIHITLKFLDEITQDQVVPLMEAIGEATAKTPPFELELGGFGVFPNSNHARVFWVGIESGAQTLKDLAQEIDRKVNKLGFHREKRPFSAHLTLGRVRDQATPADRRTLGEAVASLVIERSVPFDVSSVSLMRSTLTREGAIYNRLHEAALGGEQRERVVKDT